MMSCRDVGGHLRAFLRGELPYTERLEFHRHLAGCAACNHSVERARDALALSRSACSAAADPVPDEVPDLLVAAIWTVSRAAR
ncbi:MAG TPA: anti-sigma factor [Tepidisphaeraceae bacterium]